MKLLKLHKILSTLVLLGALLGVQGAIPQLVAACGDGSGSSTQRVLGGVGEASSDCNSDGVTNTIKTAVSILSYVVGAAAVIMVIASGFRYVTSGGDSNRVSGAKNNLIYALVGIVIAALAQFLVHFVLSNAVSAQTPPKSSMLNRRYLDS